ncbi:hypothetical protein PYH37_002180 [Sinorhizobium numidicum]|uniref:Gfo/Idh/MocA-like oxidoreductase N-terminal domain-containing protein n=1 Tax=Sinorhizobium numidicum TaxID=680248 RepID=A0ABY8CTA5_9HYPH|nr:hypothetical protein [Sinorhizobium numidicum]WEX74710.1 hypothetical protein PYH37_002180 [Sinorhizobium numidicum]WEX80702.1 hypothetical protein PYH38_002182 [Sinorhizobium numidicum]
MIEPLRVGVIGLGFFGGWHARVHADHPPAGLIGVADLDPVRVAGVAGMIGALGLPITTRCSPCPAVHGASLCLFYAPDWARIVDNGGPIRLIADHLEDLH